MTPETPKAPRPAATTPPATQPDDLWLGELNDELAGMGLVDDEQTEPHKDELGLANNAEAPPVHRHGDYGI